MLDRRYSLNIHRCVIRVKGNRGNNQKWISFNNLLLLMMLTRCLSMIRYKRYIG